MQINVVIAKPQAIFQLLEKDIIIIGSRRGVEVVCLRYSGASFIGFFYSFDGLTTEPAIRSGNTGLRIPCFDSCQLMTTLMCNQLSPGLPK